VGGLAFLQGNRASMKMPRAKAGHQYAGGTENAKSLLGFNGCSIGCRANNFHWHIRSEQL
jgi:hypothetical protein